MKPSYIDSVSKEIALPVADSAMNPVVDVEYTTEIIPVEEMESLKEIRKDLLLEKFMILNK
ncbi:hypothetical protein [Trichococcus ilyis]|uniref:hypothetical protein n=1 Tax=Trichococcus ilyis TaxID=640938 RepID=UPI001041EBB9|nr:hypothetical protein [Trichococcus ilyis]